MTKTKVAVLITVFNRKEITLKGLESLYVAINSLGKDYSFDIYLTDDGCTDGTGDAVKEKYPQVVIVKGNGQLFWGGGMNQAWKAALESNERYDYFLWYNDDSDIFPDALRIMFDTVSKDTVVTGAFRNQEGNVSYGGKTENDQLIAPNNQLQEIVKMNGNLVLIPHNVFMSVGLIDKNYIHGGGDFDYGYRVRENGFKVLLSPKYVGIAERHDEFIPRYCNKEIPFTKRWNILHNPMNSPKIHFRYNMKRDGIFKAVVYLFICYIGVCFPSLYIKVKTSIKDAK